MFGYLKEGMIDMERRRKTDWLIAQGYRLSRIPPFVTWYAPGRELKGRTDDYTLNLYRSKGFVLDRKFLDPQLWHELEYGIPRPTMTVEPTQPSGRTPRLAKAIRRAMSERDFWQGTPSELLALIGSQKQGIPKTAVGLSIKIMQPHMTNALKSYGITVDRKRTTTKRYLCLKSSMMVIKHSETR